jgi:Predicted hydrolases or acyltransferases (alpha/beta hydrolase superfamily)
MEPQIQCVKTSDGVTIAYFVIGSGAPLVLMDLPVSNLLAEWRHPGFRESYQTIARTYTVVRYNPRGFGLSERECHDFSLPAMIRDLEAVVDRLELPPFGVIAQRAITSPLAFAYAAAYPDRLTHLAVIGAVLRVPELFMRQINSVMQVPGADWEFVSENIERFSRGWDDNESSAELAALLRESIDYHAFHEFWRDLSTWDASECLPRITTPTLLIHR